MIHLRFTSASFDYDTESWQETVRADLIADGERLDLSGPDADWIDLGISVLDPDTQTRLGSEPDPERWARLLPASYRGGDLEVAVLEDTSTGTSSAQGAPEQQPAHLHLEA